MSASTMSSQGSISSSPTSQAAYPSPSLSPETSFHPIMDMDIGNTPIRRSSVKSLMSSVNPPSPLDALVMALEATAEEMAMPGGSPRSAVSENVEDEDPDATVPSSPTFFMKKSSEPSLHQLPTLHLPQSVACSSSSSLSSGVSPSGSGLTPSTHPDDHDSDHLDHLEHPNPRKMSVSSQGSVSSTNSSERKIYACTVGNCDKKFTQVAHRRIHERSHTGTRPFVCQFHGCDRAFTQLGNLKTHERKHTGERPYKCPHPGCDKTFTQLGNLKTHERIHDEVKPFMCRLAGCGKTFSQLGNLKTHTTKMHPEVHISDEELAIRTTSVYHGSLVDRSPSRPVVREGVVQVITHFNPYQRRPIKPQQSEEEKLLKKIRAMIHHQQRVRELANGSDVSDDMEE
ncbi:hypothetical protein BGZ93_008161 [Podila epicladia]|nr:hypothetical protein BGZ92_010742 [Podila epicladia]KAG0099326.1 hypothetical protein BGZ93_008161 [Podila epicladia]